MVESAYLKIVANPHNADYLETKKSRPATHFRLVKMDGLTARVCTRSARGSSPLALGVDRVGRQGALERLHPTARSVVGVRLDLQNRRSSIGMPFSSSKTTPLPAKQSSSPSSRSGSDSVQILHRRPRRQPSKRRQAAQGPSAFQAANRRASSRPIHTPVVRPLENPKPSVLVLMSYPSAPGSTDIRCTASASRNAAASNGHCASNPIVHH